MREVAKLY